MWSIVNTFAPCDGAPGTLRGGTDVLAGHLMAVRGGTNWVDCRKAFIGEHDSKEKFQAHGLALIAREKAEVILIRQ